MTNLKPIKILIFKIVSKFGIKDYQKFKDSGKTSVLKIGSIVLEKFGFKKMAPARQGSSISIKQCFISFSEI